MSEPKSSPPQSSVLSADLLRTPLAPAHEELGARMAPFGGWLMPIQYHGIVAEHLHTRASAGLFDLSHMGRLVVAGPGAELLLQRATTNDVQGLAVGQAQYSLMCTPRGRVIEDLLVYRFESYWRLIVNAINRRRVLAHLGRLRDEGRWDATIRDETFATALLGLQGPASEAVLQPLLQGDLGTLRYYRARAEALAGDGASPPIPVVVSRSGYTGEDGFELVLEASNAVAGWRRLLGDGRVRPVGLGARDTLRIEGGMALYGHELSEAVTPYEAGLGRVVRLEKGPFLGRDALAALAQREPARRLVGLRFARGAVPRAGCAVTREGEVIGEVVSGTFSPTLKQPIATAYVASSAAGHGTELAVTIRSASVPACVVSLPFVPHRTKR